MAFLAPEILLKRDDFPTFGLPTMAILNDSALFIPKHLTIVPRIEPSNRFELFGNGKIDHTPHPVGIRKIKRVSLEVFLRLKAFVNSRKVFDQITPRGDRKISILKRTKPVIAAQNCTYDYEPSNAIYVQDSLLWQWHPIS